MTPDTQPTKAEKHGGHEKAEHSGKKHKSTVSANVDAKSTTPDASKNATDEEGNNEKASRAT